MTALQVLGVALAAIAAGALAQSARLLGDEGRGWMSAGLPLILMLDACALFWMVAAIVGAETASVIGPRSVRVAGLFAAAGVLLVQHLIRNRPVRTSRKRKR